MTTKSKNALSEEIIKISRGLAIYKVNSSPFWQARIRDVRKSCYVVRSTKETSRIKARTAAQELASDLFNNEKPVEQKFTFRYYSNRLVAKGATWIAQGEKNANYVRTMKLFLNNPDWGLIKAFDLMDVRELKTRQYQEYMDSLAKTRPDLATSTRNTITATFRNVLKIARDDGVIDAIPSTPRTAQKDNPRSFFPFYPLVAKVDDLYQRVLATTAKLGKEGRMVGRYEITDELYDLVLFTAHSFVRPTTTELYALRHSDVTVAENPRRLLLTVRDGKTGFRVVNTMPAAVSVYERIKGRHPDAKPTDYLFFSRFRKRRETASEIAQRQFQAVLAEAGIEDDSGLGIKYTLYSLRHTAICMRLVLSHGGVNIFNLAKNAGTSVEQIERFYAKKLPLSPGMAMNLQQFGPSGDNDESDATATRPAGKKVGRSGS